MTNTITWMLAVVLALYLAASVLALVLPVLRGLAVTCALSVTAGIVMAGAGVSLVTSHEVLRVTFYRLQPLDTLQLRVDALSGLFLILIGAVSAGISIYSWGYMQRFAPVSLRLYNVLSPLLLLSLIGIVTANDLALFLIAWEGMSILSYILTALNTTDQRSADAGFLMLAMSQAGTAAFLTAFLLVGGATHALGFDAMRSVSGSLAEPVRDGAFLLFFFGFGAKAGVIPLHIWLPPAYSAAPSNVSAVLAGIMVNMGIYGIVRFAVQLLGPGPVWWGFVVVSIGSISALLGILYALMERDIKRFLAYSSVENVGIILIGVGASMVFTVSHLPFLAALALLAAMFHTLNHATSKTLLFLGAGSMSHATGGERNMDHLGGLIVRMPWTAALVLIGCLSIAAVPPFNGFISEWLTLETLLQNFHIHVLGSEIGLALAGVFLALTAGLAVTAFAKVFGISFLGSARSEAAEVAREAPRSMRAGMGVVALEALALGILPSGFIPWLGRVAELAGPNVTTAVDPPVYAHPQQYAALVALGGALFRPIVPGPGPIIIPGYASFAAAAPTYLAISFLIGIPLTGLVGWWLMRLRTARQAEVWVGGIDTFTPSYQYTSTSYANPIRIIFGTIYQPGKEAETNLELSRYFRMSVSYRVFVVPFFERRVYPALIGAVTHLAGLVKGIQSGSINLYLGYIFAILLIVLVAVR